MQNPIRHFDNDNGQARRIGKAMIYGLLTAAAIIVAASFIVSTKSHAQTPSVYFGVHGGQTISSTELTNSAGTISLDGLASHGYIAGIHGGVDVQLPGSIVFAGLFAGYDWRDTEFNLNVGAFNFNAALGNSWYAGGRAGVVVHGAKVYALAAWRQSEWSSSLKGLSIDDPKGFDLGIGVAVPLTKNVVVGVEGIRTQYDKDEFILGPPLAPTGTKTGIHGETDQISVLARLTFQFGGNPASIFDDEPAKPAAKPCDPKLAGCKK